MRPLRRAQGQDQSNQTRGEEADEALQAVEHPEVRQPRHLGLVLCRRYPLLEKALVQVRAIDSAGAHHETRQSPRVLHRRDRLSVQPGWAATWVGVCALCLLNNQSSRVEISKVAVLTLFACFF